MKFLNCIFLSGILFLLGCSNDQSNTNRKEGHMVVKVDKPVKQYFEELMYLGFSHHAIAIPGNFGKQLECFSRQLDIEVNWL